MKVKTILSRIYYIIVAVCVFLHVVILSLSFFDNEHQEKYCRSIIPDREYQTDEDNRRFVFSAQKIKDGGDCLRFYTAHMEVSVYADDTLIYHVGQQQAMPKVSPGVMWNYVGIPSGAEQIQVMIRAVYPEVRQKQIDFSIGGYTQMYSGMLYRSMPVTFICLLEILLGFFMVLWWLIARTKMKMKQTLLHFGTFSFLTGTWALNETDAALLILFPVRVEIVFVSAVALILMVPSFVWFTKGFFDVEDKWGSDIICALAYLNLAVQLILQLAGIRGFRQMYTVTHVLLGITLLYTIVMLISEYRKTKVHRHLWVVVVGGFILLGTLVADLLHFYYGSFQTSIYDIYGVFIYIIIFAVEVCRQVAEQVDAGQKLQLYEELATKDMLTKLYNRNAYDEWIKVNRRPKKAKIVVFDLNNLKQCNDTMGHAAGDAYIQNAAGIILHVFGNCGNCYRIGGDEFCVVIYGNDPSDMEELFRQMKQEQDEFNSKNAIPQIQIAYGYAEFDPETDRDIEDTRSRADDKMYQKKREIKADTNENKRTE